MNEEPVSRGPGISPSGARGSQLARFIADRLDEHEQGARAAPTQHWRLDPEWSGAVETEWENRHTWLAAGEDTAPHIARHDPAHVLAFVAAGRAILELHSRDEFGVGRPPTCEMCGGRPEAPEFGAWPCPTLRAFGAIWAGHPAWREEWRA